jgi:CAAX protease family protein
LESSLAMAVFYRAVTPLAMGFRQYSTTASEYAEAALRFTSTCSELSTALSEAQRMPSDPGDINDEAKPIASRGHLIFVVGMLAALLALQAFQLHRMSAHPGTNPHPFGVVPFCLMAISMEWAMVAVVWFGIRKNGISIRELVGGAWRGPLDFIRDAAIGLGAWLAWVIPSGILLSVVSDHRGMPEFITYIMPRTPLELTCWLVLSFSAGVSEEIMFRGYLQRQFSAIAGNPSAAILIQAVLFGVMHIYEGIWQVAAIAVLGVVLGYLAHWRRSLRPGIILHIWMDGLASVAMYAFMR